MKNVEKAGKILAGKDWERFKLKFNKKWAHVLQKEDKDACNKRPEGSNL